MQKHSNKGGFLRTFFLLGIGFACGYWHAEIASQIQKGYEIVRAR